MIFEKKENTYCKITNSFFTSLKILNDDTCDHNAYDYL